MCLEGETIDLTKWTDRVISGRYYYEAESGNQAVSGPTAGTGGAAAAGGQLHKVVLNLDVDGWFFLNVASLTLIAANGQRTHRILRLEKAGENRWQEQVAQPLGVAPRGAPVVIITVQPGDSTQPATATLLMTARSTVLWSLTLTKRYNHFHPLDVRFDYTDEGMPIYLCAPVFGYPKQPSVSAYPPGVEKLSVDEVYARAGFGVCSGISNEPIDNVMAGDGVWTDEELHQAMEASWKPGGRDYTEAPRWAMWCLFTSEYFDSQQTPEEEQGADPSGAADPAPDPGPAVCNLSTTSVVGIMFDAEGEAQRQGAAVFLRPFEDYEVNQLGAFLEQGEDDARASEMASAERQRRQFFTLVHELGHCLNLAHSWAKSEGSPWRELVDDPEAPSFMNRPEEVTGGADSFWERFKYRFMDDELLFLRHAPDRYVKTGLAPWFDDHGLTLETCRPVRAGLSLRLVTGRPGDGFGFLEPVCLQVELRNSNAGVAVIDPAALLGGDGLTLVVKRDGRPARLLWPYLKPMYMPLLLGAGEAAFGALFVSAGIGGWLVQEPGAYTAQACMRVQGGNVLSEPLRFEVRRGAGRLEALAGDWFQPAVARALAVGGCRSPGLVAARRVFERVVDEMPDSLLAVNARYLLAGGTGRVFKRLVAEPTDRPGGRPRLRLDHLPADAALEREQMRAVLLDPRAADAMGFLVYARRVRRHVRWLKRMALAVEGDEFGLSLSLEAERRGAVEALRYLDRLLGGGGRRRPDDR